MIPVYIEEDLYRRWREKFRGFSFSGWVQAQVMAAVDGLNFVISQETERMKHLEESLHSGTLLTKTLEETAKKERELKEKLLEESEEVRSLIRQFNKLRVLVVCGNSLEKYNAEKKIREIKQFLAEKYGITNETLVRLADKLAEGKINEQNR